MSKPVILQMGPYPPWEEAALSELYDIRRYYEAGDKAAFLAEAGPRVRGIATRGDLGADRSVIEACPNLDGMATAGDGRELVAEVEDVALELPDLLIRIRESGGRIRDLDVHPPSLHSVFIHLTGRELRE